ncbi:MAG: DNA-binding response OmpR family regulator [Candidatus Pelagisphaera sp.]|jgi:DNA-binding response OmpR family regulator
MKHNIDQEKRKALIIDDSKITRRVIKHYLIKLNFHTIEANDGRSGILELESDNSIDLVLVDWNMPNLDGPGFIKEIRRNPKFDGMKLIMLSARDRRIDVKAAVSVGADDYITKPMSVQKLMDRLNKHGLN